MTKTLISPYLISQGFGQRPDIVIATNAMQLDENAPQGVPVLTMIGSSTIRDMQRDTMQMSALQDMVDVSLDMTIWLNHSYNLPDDVFGKLHDRPNIKMAGNIADLFIRVEVETENPAAGRTYNMILRGKKFGCSVGCQVVDYEFDGMPDPFDAPIIIKHVKVVEWSVVGIPANQRCWVEQALKGLFERSLVEGRADDALRLAPAYKGLYWRDFERVVRNVEHLALQKDLERTPARATHSQFLLWDAVRDIFLLNGSRDGITATKSLSRQEASAFLDQEATTPLQKTVATDEPAIIAKSACGKADLPLADRKAAWDGPAAHNRVVDWASKADGSIDPTKMKQVHFWFDPAEPDKIGSYKLIFADVKSGKPVAVPRGIEGCAGALEGARGTGVSLPSGDIAAVKAKIAAYYRRMAKEFNDASIVAPWEQQEEKRFKATQTSASTTDTDKDILDSSSGSALNRQDLTEDPEEENKVNRKKAKAKANDDLPKAKEVEIAEDGTHEPCVGPHTHAHASYGASLKKSADAENEDEEGGAEEGMHTHEHTHNGDAHHGHDHEMPADDEEGDEAGEEEKKDEGEAEKSLDPAKAALLTAYNTIGKQLGIPAIPAVSLTKKGAGGADVDMQGVVTLISQLDQYMDDAEESASCIVQAGRLVDALMQAFDIPDIDDDDDDDDDDDLDMPAFGGMRYSLDATLTKTLAQFNLLKEGRAISTENQQKLQMIHECVKAMHPDCCKGVSSSMQEGDGTSHQDGSVSVDEARRDANFQMGNMTASWVSDLVNGMQALSKALSETNIAGIKLDINNVTKSLQAVQKQLRGTQGELTGLQNTINTLKNAPLGKPTQLNRSAVAGEASYQDMLTAGARDVQGRSDTQKEMFAQTTIVQKNGMAMRHWAAGIRAGQRPPLSGDEMSLMHPAHISAYYDGLEADVPLIDTPPTA